MASTDLTAIPLPNFNLPPNFNASILFSSAADLKLRYRFELEPPFGTEPPPISPSTINPISSLLRLRPAIAAIASVPPTITNHLDFHLAPPHHSADPPSTSIPASILAALFCCCLDLGPY